MIAKFEFKVTVHLAYGQNAPSCDPLTVRGCCSEVCEVQNGDI